MDTFKLPVSSYEEITKVIKAYGNGKPKVPVSLDELAKSSGISKFILSKNNGFLIQVDLVTKGTKKSPTEACRKLASAYNIGIHDEISTIWRGILDKDDFIASMLSFISVKSRVTRDEFISHIVYSADCGNSTAYKTGAATIIEILKMTGMIHEENGYITLAEVEYATAVQNENGYEISNKVSDESDQLPYATAGMKIDAEPSFFVQQYTCESGKLAKIVIPEDATEDDLLGFRDMLNIALKRKFKILID